MKRFSAVPRVNGWLYRWSFALGGDLVPQEPRLWVRSGVEILIECPDSVEIVAALVIVDSPPGQPDKRMPLGFTPV